MPWIRNGMYGGRLIEEQDDLYGDEELFHEWEGAEANVKSEECGIKEE